MKSPELQNSLEETETKTGKKSEVEKAETPKERLAKVDKRIDEFKGRLNMTAENALKTTQELGVARRKLEIPTPDEQPVSLEQAAESSEKLNTELKSLEEERTGLESSLKTSDSGIDTEKSVEFAENEKPLEVGDEVYNNGRFYTVVEFPSGYDNEHTNPDGTPFNGKGQMITKKSKDRSVLIAITEGGFGGGKGAQEMVKESTLHKVTAEQKAKIKAGRKAAGLTEGGSPL